MRIPIILALAVIVLTPADIRDIVHDAAGEAQVAIAKLLEKQPVQVAEAEIAPTSAALKTKHDTTKNAIANVR